jgi:hypothetical protein
MKNLSPRGSLLGSTWMATTGSRPEPAITSTCGRILSLIYPIWPLLANSCFLPIPMLLGFPRARECFHFYVPPCGHGRGGSPSNRAGAQLADTQLTRNNLLSKAKSKSKPDGSNWRRYKKTREQDRKIWHALCQTSIPDGRKGSG